MEHNIFIDGEKWEVWPVDGDTMKALRSPKVIWLRNGLVWYDGAITFPTSQTSALIWLALRPIRKNSARFLDPARVEDIENFEMFELGGLTLDGKLIEADGGIRNLSTGILALTDTPLDKKYRCSVFKFEDKYILETSIVCPLKLLKQNRLTSPKVGRGL